MKTLSWALHDARLFLWIFGSADKNDAAQFNQLVHGIAKQEVAPDPLPDENFGSYIVEGFSEGQLSNFVVIA